MLNMHWGKIRMWWCAALLLMLLPTATTAEPQGTELLGSKEYLLDDTDSLLQKYLQAAANSEATQARVALLLAQRLQGAILADPQTGVEELQMLETNNKIDPLARDMALCLLADKRNARGEFEAGKKLLSKRGAVPQWLIAGPFGRYDRASFYETFPPEKTRDLTTKMRGIGREVEWRIAPESLYHFDPWEWLFPRRGIVYLLTAFRLKQDTTVTLDLQTQCAYSLWLDAQPAGTADRLEAELPERQLLSCGEKTPLKAGWHTLLVKLYGFTENRVFDCRLLDNALTPIQEVEYARDMASAQNAIDAVLNSASSNNKAILPRWLDPISPTITTTAKSIHGTTNVLRAAGLQLNAQTDRALQYWQELEAILANNAAYWSRRGECESRCVTLPEPRRESLSYLSHKKAIALAPDCVPSLLALAEHEQRNRRFADAAAYYEKALKANPASVRALAGRVKMAIDNGWNEEARRWLDDLRTRHPQALAGLLLDAERTDLSGGLPRSAAALEKVFLNDRANLPLALEAARFFASAGDAEHAQKILFLLPPELTASPTVLEAKGQMLLHGNQPAQAAATFQQASIMRGGDALALRALGEAQLMAGDINAARAALQESLLLFPGQQSLRQLLADLNKSDYAFWKAYSRDAFTTLKKFNQEKRNLPGKTARLIDQTILTVYPDGSYDNYTHELQLVLNPGGVKNAAQIQFYGNLLSARTILPEKELVLEPVILPGQNQLTMPALAVGAAVDYSYLQEGEASGDLALNFPKWYFRSPDSEESFLFSQYIVRVAPNTPFTFAARNLTHNMHFEKKTEEDGTQVFIWTGQDMPLAIHEEGSPSIDESLPFVAVGSARDWDGVNRLFLNYYVGRITPNTAIQNLSKKLSTNNSGKELGEREQAEAIFDFVCRSIEKAGSFSPASYILDQRAGDRVLLLLSMLRAAGLKADFAAARPTVAILAQPLWDLPASGVFTNFIVRAKLSDGSDLWLDPTFRFQQAGRLTEQLAGGSAFITGRENGEFTNLPPAQADEYTVKETRRCSLREREMLLSGTRTIPGIGGLILKERLEDAGKSAQQNLAEELLAGKLAGLELDSFSLPGVNESQTPFQLKYTATVPGALRERIDGQQGLPLGLNPLPLLPREDSVQRQTPYHLDRYVSEESTFEFLLPEGAGQADLPAEILLRSEFGFYQLSFEQTRNIVRLTRRCHFPPQRIALKRWSAYYAMTQKINDAENALLWWR